MRDFCLRVLRFPLTLMVIGFVPFSLLYGLMMALSGLSPGKINGHRNPIAGTMAEPLVALAGAVVSIWLYRRYCRLVEGADNNDFAMAGAGRQLGVGLACGAGLFGLLTATVALMGGYGIDGVRGIGNLWEMLALAILSGVFEEMVFRGIIFRHLEQLVGSAWALIAVSALFGAAHLANPGATWFAAVAIACEAGLLFGAVYMLTRRLWAVIGLHAAWNFTQGWVFSIPVSGQSGSAGLLISHRIGPAWLTGGAFGLEASAVAAGVASLAGCVAIWQAWRRGAFVAPLWTRRRAASQAALQTKE